MRDERGPWYLLTGVILGLVLGLLYAWLISPVEFIDNPPSSLHEDFKDQYRALISAAYMANGDLGRARARLALLGDDDVYRTLIAQAERTLSQGGGTNEARALGSLAAAINQAQNNPTANNPATGSTANPQNTDLTPQQNLTADLTPPQSPSPTIDLSVTPTNTPRPTSTTTPTRTPLPTRTPTATPGAPFTLEEQELVCDPAVDEPLIQVVTLDADGNQVPGVEVVIRWEAGEERVFTGLKPEIGLGYADFLMTSGITYAIQIADGEQAVTDLSAQECATTSGLRYWGYWSLVFAQPEP